MPNVSSWREAFRDRALAAGLKRGDLRAWNQFYVLYATPLYRFAYSHCGGPSVAHEITQDTLAAAVEGIARYQPFRATLWAWLCGIAVNKRREMARDEAREARIRENLAAISPAVDDPPPDDKARELLHAMTTLHPHHQEVLTLKYLQGVDVKTMAAQLGQSGKAIESRLTRARDALRRAYENQKREQAEGERNG